MADHSRGLPGEVNPGQDGKPLWMFVVAGDMDSTFNIIGSSVCSAAIYRQRYAFLFLTSVDYGIVVSM